MAGACPCAHQHGRLRQKRNGGQVGFGCRRRSDSTSALPNESQAVDQHAHGLLLALGGHPLAQASRMHRQVRRLRPAPPQLTCWRATLQTACELLHQAAPSDQQPERKPVHLRGDHGAQRARRRADARRKRRRQAVRRARPAVGQGRGRVAPGAVEGSLQRQGPVVCREVCIPAGGLHERLQGGRRTRRAVHHASRVALWRCISRNCRGLFARQARGDFQLERARRHGL
mmetsp:Transcript_100972/g.324168  ORF Transcript_100972/g.324168 Transcript_100972/m.324168 type:complete len:229 (-) Transcript_100972:40-726(-)